MPESEMIECARLMSNWSGGQGDPVYMVLSYFIDGEDYPDLGVVARARDAIECEFNHDHSEEEQEELCKITDFLSAYLEEKVGKEA